MLAASLWDVTAPGRAAAAAATGGACEDFIAAVDPLCCCCQSCQGPLRCWKCGRKGGVILCFIRLAPECYQRSADASLI